MSIGLAVHNPSSYFDLKQRGINVKQAPYNAKGDGVTDDTTAIQNAINDAYNHNLGKVIIPSGSYLIKNPLNLTNFKNGGLIIEGQGSNVGTNQTILLAETGGILFDLAGSQYITMRDFWINGKSGATPSTIGIFQARTSIGTYAQFCNFENLKIDLQSISTANNNQGTVGLYNFGAELWRGRNVDIVADTPIVFTGDNSFWNLQSAYQTVQTGIVSMSECTMDGVTTLTSYNGPAINIISAVNIKFDNAYLNSFGGSPTFAIKLQQTNYQIVFSGHIEVFPQVLMTRGVVYNLDLNCTYGSGGATAIVVDGNGNTSGGIRGSRINAQNMTATNHNLINRTGSLIDGLRSVEIHLYSTQSIQWGGGAVAMAGIFIKAYYANPTVILPKPSGGQSYIVTHDGGTNFFGPVNNKVWQSGATSARPTSAVQYQEFFDTTLGKPVWCKTAGTAEVDEVSITAGPTASGNITVTLNGTSYTVAVTAGMTPGQVGDAIRATGFPGWTLTGGSGSANVFCMHWTGGTCSAPTFTDSGTTGTTATTSVSTAGTNPTWQDATGATV